MLDNKASRNATNSTGFQVGLGYLMPSSPVKGYGNSVDFLFNSNSGHGNRIETMGLFYSLRKAPEGKSDSQFYYGASLGVAQSKYKTNTAQVGEQAVSTSADDTGVAGRLLVGVMLKGGLIIEGAYNITPQVKVGNAKVKTTSLSLSVGKAF
ncbi:MAG: hypothetical protein QM758_24870 [Armatimonas sp.]